MKRCPPGTICVENITMILVIAIVILTIYFIYKFNEKEVLNNKAHVVYREKPLFNMTSKIDVPDTGYNMLRPMARPGLSYNENPKDVLLNPYSPPLQVNQPHKYKQIGYLKNEEKSDKMFPLFAKPQHIRRDKWYYYTIYDNIKLPIYFNNRKCMSDTGCDSLMNGDIVKLENMTGNYIVSTYDNETLVYDPSSV